MGAVVIVSGGNLAGLICCGFLFFAQIVSAMAEESWVALATGSDSRAVYAYLVRRINRNDAEIQAMNHCHAAGRRCTFLHSWNQGCIVATAGLDSDGRAYLGTGPTRQSARQQCEKNGADCSQDVPAVVCALETPSDIANSPPPMHQAPGTRAPTVEDAPRSAPRSYDVSRGSPGYRADEDEGPGDAGEARRARYYLPAEDMAKYSTNRGRRFFELCPENDRGHRCFYFVDGDKPGRSVTNARLFEAESKFKGGREGGAEDTSLEFSTLLNSLDRNELRVRYQFADLAKGTTDGHYEGLMCFAYAAEEKKDFPTWQSCGYVTEVRARRTGG